MFLQAKLKERFLQMVEDSKKQGDPNGSPPNDLLRKTDQFPASPPPKPRFQP